MKKIRVLIITQANAPKTMELEDKIENASIVIEKKKIGFQIIENKLYGEVGFMNKGQIELYKKDNRYEVEEYEDKSI